MSTRFLPPGCPPLHQRLASNFLPVFYQFNLGESKRPFNEVASQKAFQHRSVSGIEKRSNSFAVKGGLVTVCVHGARRLRWVQRNAPDLPRWRPLRDVSKPRIFRMRKDPASAAEASTGASNSAQGGALVFAQTWNRAVRTPRTFGAAGKEARLF